MFLRGNRKDQGISPLTVCGRRRITFHGAIVPWKQAQRFYHSQYNEWKQAILQLQMMNKISYIILVYVFAITQSQHFKKIVNNYDPEAKCLDGSPPIYYIHQGLVKSNFIIWFYGGGFFGAEDIPSTLQTAYQRSKTIMGSSLPWPQTQSGGGYLSPNPLKSKFAEWTKIMVPYCDGALHQGHANQPIRYKEATLYFRGSKITRSLFQELNQKYSLFNSSKVVLTGASAGGLATFIWSNYLRSKLHNPNNLYTIPDTGVFLNQSFYESQKYLLSNCLMNTFKFANVDQLTPNQICNNKYPGEQYKCFFFEYAFDTIQGQILLLESEYDFFSIMFIQNILCPSPGKVYYTLQNCNKVQIYFIQQYKNKFLALMAKYLELSVKNSIWAIACSGHGFGANDGHYQGSKQKIPESKGFTCRDAVQKFVFDNLRVQAVDLVSWPQNKLCAF